MAGNDWVDIAIVGAGIAGAALASALADSGLRIALLDRNEGPLDTARGDNIQPALLPVLRRWGVLDALIDAGAESRQGTRWFDCQQQPIVTVPASTRDDLPPGFLFLNHEHIGRILLDRAREGGARYLPGIARWTLGQDDRGWSLALLRDGKEEMLRCTLLVGADGAASRVRSQLNIPLERHNYRYPIAILFGKERNASTPRTLDVHLTQDRIVSLIPRTGGLSKVAFPIDPSELSQWRDQPGTVLAEQLRQWCPTLEFESLEFGAIYPPVSQHAPPYDGPGLAVLIGDACHAMHPARSMGMNTCFRVTDQLAKLFQNIKTGFSAADIAPMIEGFNLQSQRELTPLLAENHTAGLQMDTLSGNGFKELTQQLRAASQDNAILEAMARKASGWST